LFQSFDETADPQAGPARLAGLRRVMAAQGLDGFIVPRADAHQGEYVAARDDRLAWLTGFTGSAGYCVALMDRAGVFVDSRYRVQVRAQVADAFTPVDWPETGLADWICAHSPETARIGFDPWLMPLQQRRDLAQRLGGRTLVPCNNPVDAIWEDQPAPPMGAVEEYPQALSGQSRDDRIARIAAALGECRSVVLSLPDSIAWLINIRGSDVAHTPIAHGFAILHAAGTVDLFMEPAKCAGLDLGAQVTVQPPAAFLTAVARLDGPVMLDPASTPVAVADALASAGISIQEAADPCQMPKACKTDVELAGSRAAHLRDGAAIVRLLSWVQAQTPGSFSEIDVVTRLESERRATNALRDISFDTISGAGPNGAIVHYRVTHASNRSVQDGDLLLLDSGGQYQDGTTDITRTLSIGQVGEEERRCFTLVLKGLIALSSMRWPAGLTGRDLDAFARAPLWQAGLDYGHGTGHGVGAYLSVHEGPQRLARSGTVALEPGMILSIEPGFYREGAFGIRIENLAAVRPAPALPGQTVGQMLCFETLTFAPIDRRLIDPDLLSQSERAWLDAYHAQVLAKLAPALPPDVQDWLRQACAPL